MSDHNRPSKYNRTPHIVYRFPHTHRLATLHFIIHEVGNFAKGTAWNHNRAISPFWRLYHNETPGSFVEFEGSKLKLHPNQIVLVPREANVNLRGRVGTPHSWIHFSIEPRYLLNEHSPFTMIIDEIQRDLLSKLKELTNYSEIEVKNLLEQKLILNAASLVQYTFLRKPLQMRDDLPQAILMTLGNIENSKFTHFSNKLLAQQAGMSIEGFIRLFKKKVGLTPAVFVRQRRIHEACKLLTFTEDSIEEIASKLGFLNRHHFSRLFAQQLRCGPATFRKNTAASTSTIL